jgi:hypothetical protein
LPGTTITRTLPGGGTITQTVPGTVTTITQTESVTTVITTTLPAETRSCTRRLAPTGKVLPEFPKDYTWGCKPGYICSPKDRCDTEPPPSRYFACVPEDCVKAPPVPKEQDWPKDLKHLNGTYIVTPPFYPLDPYKFGLNDSIFCPPPANPLTTKQAELTTRQDQVGLESCYSNCGMFISPMKRYHNLG